MFATIPEIIPSDPIFEPISDEELSTAQLSDDFCSDIRRRLNGGVAVPFGFNDRGLLCRKTEAQDQIVIPHALKARVLHINHYSRLAGHPGGKKLYHTIRKDMYWPSLSVDCYAAARRCSTCARNRIKLRRHTSQLKLFPASAPLEAVAIDILGELIKTSQGNQYLLVISDRYTKLTKTVPLKSQSATEVAKAFVNEWVFNYGPPLDLLADNGKCFTSKFFQDVCRIINVHNSFTTTYHPQANGQVERFNRTIKSAIRSYLSDHPMDWDLYTGALTFAYNCQPHSSTALAPFELVLSRPPPALALKTQPRISRGPIQERQRWKQWLQKALVETKERLRRTQERYKRNYDARLRRQSETIKSNDYIYLRVERRDENETRHKLAAVADGPYRVVEATPLTVVIERPYQTVERVSRDRVTLAPLPRSVEEIQEAIRPMTDEELIPDEFPVSESTNLRDLPIRRSRINQPTDENPEQEHDPTENREPQRELVHDNEDDVINNNDETVIEDTDGNQEYVIERIISHGVNEDPEHPSARIGETTYQVRWYGYGPEDDTYEPIRNLPRNKVVSYHKRKKLGMPQNIDDAMSG